MCIYIHDIHVHVYIYIDTLSSINSKFIPKETLKLAAKLHSIDVVLFIGPVQNLEPVPQFGVCPRVNETCWGISESVAVMQASMHKTANFLTL